MSKTLRRFILSTAGLALIGVFGLACAPAAEAPQKPGGGATAVKATPKQGGTFNYYYNRNPVGLDPHKTIADPTQRRVALAYSTLMGFPYDPDHDPGDMTVIPNLAESWEQVNDTTLLIHLRKGVKFHNKPPVNGRELVADDVKYSFERLKKVSAERFLLDKVTRIDVVDPYTVKLVTDGPFAPLLTYLGYHTAVILAKEVEEKYGDFSKPEAVIGTGPFILKEHQDDVNTAFVRNPDYFKQGMPYVDSLNVLMIPDPSTRMAAFRSGQLAVNGTLPDEFKFLKSTSPEFQFFEVQAFGLCFTGFRNDQKPFNDVRVRRAVSLAVDRRLWNKTIQDGVGNFFNGPIPAGMKNWYIGYENLGPEKQWLDVNVDLAKRLLAEAGYPNGFKTKLQHSAYYGPERVQQLELVRDFVSKIGIEIEIDLREYAQFISGGYAGNFEGMVYVCETAQIDPDSYLWGQFYPGELRNHSLTNDPTLNKMLTDQRTIIDLEKRKKVVYDAQRYIIDQAFNVYSPIGTSTTVAQPWVRNFVPKIYTYPTGLWFEGVWFDK